jgi:hypothetical protein
MCTHRASCPSVCHDPFGATPATAAACVEASYSQQRALPLVPSLSLNQHSDRVFTAAGFTISLGVLSVVGNWHVRAKRPDGGQLVDALAVLVLWALVPVRALTALP